MKNKKYSGRSAAPRKADKSFKSVIRQTTRVRSGASSQRTYTTHNSTTGPSGIIRSKKKY